MGLKIQFVLILVVLHGSSMLTPGEPEPDPGELPRIPPREPASAIQAFQLAPGFRVELVACEPQVVDPVAIAFDEDGRLFVAEMRGYPERREQALGRIRCLEDRDRDGHYEHSSVFAENLKWPTGIVCWKGGVFVTASPDILYLGDRDRDGVSDERRVVFTGFGEGLERLNMQALVNNLQWGPNGRIYGSTASNGGLVRVERSKGGGVNLRGSVFSFDPDKLGLRPESGTAQYGLSFGDFGRRYLCSNSRHLIAVMYSWPWNRTKGLPHPLVEIPVDGGAAEVYRISKVEPWRVVRTRWRVQGRVRGPVEGGGRAAGYFTSASGLTVYRGGLFGEEHQGSVFIGDVGSNLVHQKLIEFPRAGLSRWQGDLPRWRNRSFLPPVITGFGLCSVPMARMGHSTWSICTARRSSIPGRFRSPSRSTWISTAEQTGAGSGGWFRKMGGFLPGKSDPYWDPPVW